jgi:hypothetical protein
MKFITLTLTAGLFAGLIATACFTTQADARRSARPHARAHVAAHNVRRGYPVRAANRVYRRGHWVNGVWVAGAVATGVAVAASGNCGYYWNRWKATGSAYWHDRYYEHCR